MEKKNFLDDRGAGILMPISSLASPYGIGTLGEEAYHFVDRLVKAGQKYWQVLPAGPTSFGDSPYQSFSAFAGNPYFIDLDTLIEEGLLLKDEVTCESWGDDPEDVDYAILFQNRFRVLKKAYKRSRHKEQSSYRTFCRQNAYWLADYCLYMALKFENDNKEWQLWEEDIRFRKKAAVKLWEKKLADEIGFWEFCQYKFYEQWNRLKKYAHKKKIRLIGDIPLYVSMDSADVWAHPELFQLDESGQPTAVAGCPPDGFSATGQLWGNPVYKWDYHKQTGYTWWIKRIENSTKLYDVIRIDHFRGFDEYYAIPAGSKNAVIGKWEKGPGMDLFDVVKEKLGEISIIAEDLGYITDSVRQLVKDSNFPNMKVLEFAFDARDSYEPCEYLPFTYYNNCVVYTGTHDNDTLLGWMKTAPKESVKFAKEYLNLTKEEGYNWGMMRGAWSSVGELAVVPMQDLIGLGSEARMNTPSTLGGNWQWRATSDQITVKLAKRLYNYMEMYGRLWVGEDADRKEQ